MQPLRTAIALGLIALAGTVPATALAKPQIFFDNESPKSIEAMNLDGTGRHQVLDGNVVWVALNDLTADATTLYFSDPHFERIGSVAFDGTGVNPSLVNVRAFGASPTAIAVQNGVVYFAWLSDANRSLIGIGRTATDGSDVRSDLIPSGALGAPVAGDGITSLTSDGTYLYWANADTGEIGRARLDGSGVQPAFISAVPEGRLLSFDIAVGHGHI